MTTVEKANPSIRELIRNTPILVFVTQGRHVVSVWEHHRGERRKLPEGARIIAIGGRS
jgi:hypothetical protein